MKHLLILFVAILVTSVSRVSAGTQNITNPADSLPLLNRPAPPFQLKDLNGKTVKLSDYKGRVLVLDFWATWCVYCHEAFPSVKKAVNKYAGSKDVAFLFIDTRERTADYKSLINKDAAKQKYDFPIVLDEKGKDGEQNKYYLQYGMAGIPTQFIIDRKGIIRYKLEGHATWKSDDQLAAELVNIIEKTKEL